MISCEQLEAVRREYGLPAYLFDADRFRENFRLLSAAMSREYAPYRIAYSYKTNYTPRICSLVREMGGMAEVVSGMEYALARRLGNEPENILFNGPGKGEEGIAAALDGAAVLVDNLDELSRMEAAAAANPEKRLRMGLRFHLDIGSGKPSRFGLPTDETTLLALKERIAARPNLILEGIHCHISGSRSIEGWRARAEGMLALADKLFPHRPPRFIDLGSGMFGRLPEALRESFHQDIPAFEDYAEAVGPLFRERYGHLPPEERPTLITEPGTTLVADTMQYAARVTAIKELPGKTLAVLDASIHTLGVISQMRNLPLEVHDARTRRENVDFTGYTCLEYDILYRGYTGPLDVGSTVVFDNIGSYSNVLKPPFIRPDAAMVEYGADGHLALLKRRETAEDIFRTYFF